MDTRDAIFTAGPPKPRLTTLLSIPYPDCAASASEEKPHPLATQSFLSLPHPDCGASASEEKPHPLAPQSLLSTSRPDWEAEASEEKPHPLATQSFLPIPFPHWEASASEDKPHPLATQASLTLSCLNPPQELNGKPRQPAIEFSVPRRRRRIGKTRRAGRKTQLRRILTGYYQGAVPRPSLSLDQLVTGQSENHEVPPIRKELRIVEVKPYTGPRYQITRDRAPKGAPRRSWVLAPLDYQVVYPGDIPREDPRYEKYIRKRAQILYPLPPLER